MIFKPSKEIKINVLPEQEKQLSSMEKIKRVCKQQDVFAFDIYKDSLLIGFVMVQKFDEGAYFLWNYAIDFKYQNKKYGTTALIEFINFMKEKYKMIKITTTYKYGNEHAKHIYEKIGFVQTDVVNENDCHEVNMIYYL